MLAGILAGLTRRVSPSSRAEVLDSGGPLVVQVLGEDLVAGAAGSGGSEFVGAYTEQEGQGSSGLVSAHERAARLSPLYFAQKVLTSGFLVGDFHREWEQLVLGHTRVCLLAPRDHGKCSRGDDLLLAADGSRIRVDEWKGGKLVAWDEQGRRFVKAFSPAARPNGVRPAVEITTRTGRSLVVTENHPLLTLRGWKDAGDIRVGDQIGVARELAGVGSTPMQSPWLLGLLIGDGGLTGSGVTVTIADPDLVRAAREEAQLRGWQLKAYSGLYHYGISAPHSPRDRTPGRWLDTLGARGGAYDKLVPNAVFCAPDEHIAEFVAGYFDADGAVNEHGGGAVEFYSVSRGLLAGVQHLLTRLGVLSVLTHKLGKYNGEDHHSWRLTARGVDAVRFARRVRLRGVKARRLENLVSQLASRGPCSGACVDRFPAEVWGMLSRSEDWHRKRGGARPVKAYRPTREKVRKVAKQEENADLLRWADAPVFWDEVVSLDHVGEISTWAVSVEGCHTYVSNDVVNHNSYFWSFVYPLWRAYQHRPISGGRGQIYILSATAEQAAEKLDLVRQELESNPQLKHLVPPGDRKRAWSRYNLQLANNYWIRARGFGVRIRGGHPQDIVVDDGINDETIYSPTTRQRQIDYFFSAISNMVTPGGRIVVVGTPFAVTDLYGALRKTPAYTYREYPALRLVPGPGGQQVEVALFPERYTVAQLHWKRDREIGPIRFAREFQVQALADDLSLFPSRLFVGDPVEQPLMRLGLPLQFWRERGIVSVFQGVDFGLSAEIGADFTVIFTLGLDDHGNRWLLEIRHERGLSYQAQLSLLNEQGRLYQPGLMLLEANQAQRIFGDELIRTTDLPIKLHHTGVEKHALEKGVPSIRILLENRKYRIPRGDERSVELTNRWMHEMTALTLQEGRVVSLADHDDLPMACVAPGALVTTKAGKKPIELVQVGERVLTHRGNWGRVLATQRRRHVGPILRVRASGGNSFRVTPEHPIYSARPAFAKDGTNRLVPDPTSWEFRESRLVRAGRKLAGDYGWVPTPRWPTVPAEFDLADFVDFRRSSHGGNCWKKDEDFIWWRADRKVPRKLKVDEDFAFLVGIYLAEGSTGGHQIHLGLHQRETYIRDFFFSQGTARFSALHGDDLGVGCSEGKYQGKANYCGMTAWMSTVPGARWFKQMGAGRSKGMPDAWMGWPLALRLQVVRGWLVGDGCLHAHCLKAVTISQRLRDQMLWTLREAGFSPEFCRFSNVGAAWKITLHAQDTQRLLRSGMNPVELARWGGKPLSDKRGQAANVRSIPEKDGVVVRFSEVAPEDYDGEVFNLQVEGDESYVVEDLAVHNCWLTELAIGMGAFSFSMGLETMGQGALPVGQVALAAAGLAGQIPPGSQVVQGVPLLGGQQGVVIGQPAPQRWASSQPPPPPPMVGKSLWELQQGWGVPAGGMPPTLVADQTAVKKPE